NCATHNNAKTPRLATGSAIARHDAGHALVTAATRSTTIVDAARPESASIQNGSTSRAMLPWPVRPHTQRRFPRYDGTTPHATATTLATAASTPAPSVSATRIDALRSVVPTETQKHRRTRAISTVASPAAPTHAATTAGTRSRART